jgi:hypothetical protein
VGRQRALHTENSGFAHATLLWHISTFRGYRILFSIRNPYINRKQDSSAPRHFGTVEKDSSAPRKFGIRTNQHRIFFQTNRITLTKVKTKPINDRLNAIKA